MDLDQLERKFRQYSLLRESGKIEEAIEKYKFLMSEAERLLFSQVPEMIGVSYRMLDKNKLGIPYAKTSIKWAIKAHDKEQEANCRRDLGGLYSSLDQFSKAKKEYRKSLHLLWQENEGRVNGIAGTLSALGRLARKQKDYKIAHEFIQSAIAMTYPSTIEHPDGQDTGQYYLFVFHDAEVYCDEGNKPKAIETATKALDGFKKLGQTVRLDRAKKLLDELTTSKNN